MANAYSYLNNFNEPLYSPNFGLIGQALSFKQDNLNQNRANVQKYYDDTIASLDALKTQDRDYINQRVTAVTDLVNQYANQDLSSPGLTQALQTDVSQIVDDNVKNAVISTKRFRAEQEEWEEYKKKNPDTYSQRNYEFAMRQAQNYLNDGETGSLYQGGGGVRPYRDVEKKLNDFLPNHFKDKGIEERIDESGNKYYYDVVKKQNITKGEVMQAMGIALSEEDRDQLSINAWASARGLDDNSVKSLYSDKLQTDISKNEDYIKQIDLDLVSGKFNDSQKEYLNNQKSQITSENNRLKNIDVNSVNRDSAVNDLYFSSFNDRYTSAYAVDNKVISIKREENKLEMERFRQTHEINKITMQGALDLEKQVRAQQANGASSLGGTGRVGADGEIVYENRVTQTVTELENKTDTYINLSENITAIQSKLITDGDIPDIYQEGVDATKTLAEIKAFGENGSSTINGKSFTGEKRKQILALKDSYKKLADVNTETDKVIKKDINKMYQAMVKSQDINPETDLDDYDFKAVPIPGTKKFKLAEKTANDLSYGKLVQMHKDSAKEGGIPLTADQMETLKLYNRINYAKSTLIKEGDDKSVKYALNSFLLSTSGEYENGKTLFPNTTEDLEGNTQVRVFEGKPSDRSWLFNTQDYVNALDKISEKFFDNKFIAEVREGNMLNLSADLYPPKEVEALADRIKYKPNYKFTPEDKALMDKVKRRRFSTPNTTAKWDGTFAAMGSDDLERNSKAGVTDYNTLATGTFKSGLKEALNSSSALDKYNKGIQKFTTFVNKPEQRQAILDQLKENKPDIQLKYDNSTKTYGEMMVTVDKNGEYSVKGDFEVYDSKEGKMVPASTGVMEDLSKKLAKDELNKVGLGYNIEKVTTYDIGLGVDKASKNVIDTKIDSDLSRVYSEQIVGTILSKNLPSVNQQAVVEFGNKVQESIRTELVPTKFGYDIVYKAKFPNNKGGSDYTEFYRHNTNKPQLQIDDVANFLDNNENDLQDPMIITSFAQTTVAKMIEAGIISEPNEDITSSEYRAQSWVNSMTRK